MNSNVLGYLVRQKGDDKTLSLLTSQGTVENYLFSFKVPDVFVEMQPCYFVIRHKGGILFFYGNLDQLSSFYSGRNAIENETLEKLCPLLRGCINSAVGK